MSRFISENLIDKADLAVEIAVRRVTENEDKAATVTLVFTVKKDKHGEVIGESVLKHVRSVKGSFNTSLAPRLDLDYGFTEDAPKESDDEEQPLKAEARAALAKRGLVTAGR